MRPSLGGLLESRTAHPARIEGELQPNPLASSGDIAILHGIPHCRHMGKVESDDLDLAIPFPLRSLTCVDGMALIIGLQIGCGIVSVLFFVSNHVMQPFTTIFVGVLVWRGLESHRSLNQASVVQIIEACRVSTSLLWRCLRLLVRMDLDNCCEALLSGYDLTGIGEIFI